MIIKQTIEKHRLKEYFNLYKEDETDENLVFLHRIETLFYCYGTAYDFIKFFFLFDDKENKKGLICCYNNIATIFSPNISLKSAENLSMFLLSCGDVLEILSSQKVCDKIKIYGDFDNDFGNILIKKYTDKNKLIDNITIKEIEIKQYYDFLCINYDNYQICFQSKEDYEKYYCDINHKIRHNHARLFGLFKKQDNLQLIAVCGILFKTKNLKYLGGICTKKELRKNGFGKIITDYCSCFENTNSYLFTENEKLTKYYNSLDYNIIGNWSVLKKKFLSL